MICGSLTLKRLCLLGFVDGGNCDGARNGRG